jgi:hypothetical protein
MALEQSEAILDRKGYIYAHLLDDKFMPIVKDKVTAKLTLAADDKGGPSKTEDVTFYPIPGRPGEYRMLAAHDQAGRYEIKIPGMDAVFNYQVKEPPGHEKQKGSLAEDVLKQAAALSLGSDYRDGNPPYYREEDLHRLASDIRAQTTPFALHQEILLWNPLAFVIFLLLITAEWVLRKFANLS